MKAHPGRRQDNPNLNERNSLQPSSTLPASPPTYPVFPNQPLKAGFFNEKVTVALWLLILMVIGGAGLGFIVGYSGTITNQIVSTSNDANQNPSSANNSQDSSTLTDVPTLAPTIPVGPVKIGNTITDNGIDCTLVSVKYLPDDGIDTQKLETNSLWCM